MTADDVTFGLALLGYALLAWQFVATHRGHVSLRLSMATATVVATHVACVWGLRFDWSVARMIDKSLPGFVIFHSALLLALSAPLANGTRHRWLTTGAFALVTAGALPAPFRYPELSLLTLPLFAIAVAAAIGFVRTRRS